MTELRSRRFYICTLQNKENVSIVFPERTEERLNRKCFRGKQIQRAGNFFAWDSFYEMIHEESIRRPIEIGVKEAVKEYFLSNQRYFDESLEIECAIEVGWSSTISIEEVGDDEVEPFYFSKKRKLTALRIRTDIDITRFAPRTRFVTIVYRLAHKVEAKDWIAFITSIYPGRDYGPEKAEGDVSDLSAREGLVFFDFDHPGIPC